MRAQATIEFLMLTAVVLSMIVALLQAYSTLLESGNDFEQRLATQRLADDVARHINRVLQSGNASQAQIHLPSLLSSGFNYSIKILGRRVEVRWDYGDASALLLTRSVNATFTTGATHNITNIHGGIVVAPA